tara:strand:+ start:4216 stop:6270 length:2055 start_codon:yes stop_codon:yes gene_type:complete
MILKIKFLIIKIIYRILQKKLLLSKSNFYINLDKNENNFLVEDKFIEPDIEGKLTLQTARYLKKGWYFFGVMHNGDNRNSILRLEVSKFFSQRRPAFPNKRRWRIIRKNKNSKILFHLTQLRNPIQINEIWIIRIPDYFAWFKIKNRLIKSTSRKYVNSQSNKQIWKKYNAIFVNQIKQHKIFTYLDWIKLIEQPIIEDNFNFCKIKNQINDNFVVLNQLKKENNKNWILIKRENVVISKNFKNIIRWLDFQKKDIEILYGDEDHISNENIRYNPIFKSSWNRELFWSDAHFSSHWIINSNLWNEILDKNLSITEFDFDKIVFIIISKIIENKKEFNIKHIPFITCHRLENFYTSFSKNKSNIHLIELNKHLKKNFKNKYKSIIRNQNHDFINWSTPKNLFLSIIIPTKDKVNILNKCIRSIKKYNSGSDIEIIIVNNKSVEDKTIKYLDQFKKEGTDKITHRVINFNKKFNYSAINNYGVRISNGNTILLVNNDVEFLSNDWDIHLASNANRDDIGCVGAKLIFDNKTIQHAGVVLGIGGIAGHSHKYFSYKSEGYFGRLKKIQEYSAVTGACLCITKSKWNQIGGLDEINLAVNYSDVDLCLKARQINLRNIYLPQVLAIHHESKTRGTPKGETYIQWKKEYKYMKKRWRNYLKDDPFYSPYLSQNEENWSISMNQKNLSLR